MGTKIVESGVDSIASGKSVSLSTLHLQIGRECQSARSDLHRYGLQCQYQLDCGRAPRWAQAQRNLILCEVRASRLDSGGSVYRQPDAPR